MWSLMLDLLQAILLLLIILDPFTNAPYFYILTKDFNPKLRSSIIKKSVLIASTILFVFSVSGDILFSLMGVSVGDFKVAGGLVLLIYSVLGLLEISTMPKPEADKISIVPMATPLLAGPGAVTAVIYIKYTWGLEVSLLSILVCSSITLAILLSGEKMLRLLGRNGTTVLDKVMSMLMAAYAISLIREGL
jgi:multiple antibiotic resistance protein